MHHFVTEQDVAEEFYTLLSKARELYLQEVIMDGKRYDRYVEDLVNSHRYIDCDKAGCQNCHEMNIHIVKGLLIDCADLVKPLFSSDSFSFDECMELKRTYDTSGSLPITDKQRVEEPINDSPLSLGCNFSREQMASIVSCANTYHLFCVSTCIEDMEALFACKEGFRIRVNNLRHVAILLDALLENSLIQSRWQAVLDKGRFLLSKDGERSVSATSLSSALSAVRKNRTSVAAGIRRAVERLKE